ncbi:antibiotic biosynthesis monooxygenase [Kitasatospora sp. NBC_01560]|uniref:putative quinol monooxygenase n=1 Tax=Kitasatospora sp. NBC_01560 TaxID=2975965 RepID=UPI00386D61C7
MSVLIVANWTVRAGAEEEIAELLPVLAEASLAEPGCLGYRPLRSVANPAEFLLVEEYADEAAVASHQKSEHYRTLVVERAVPLLTNRVLSGYAAV